MVETTTRRLLGEIFALQLMGKSNSKELAARTLPVGSLKRRLQTLKNQGLVDGSIDRPRLTPKGRSSIRVVFIGGGFEIVHPGHLFTIEQAKKLGDVLVVVLARSSTIRARKGREPVADEESRRYLIASLRPVDAAILGVEGSIYDSMQRVGPDVVALGYDQHHAEEEILEEAKKRGLKLKVVRLKARNRDVKTSKILAEFI